MRDFVFATIFIILVAAPTYAAPTLYGSDAEGNLFRIDIASGSGTLVGVLPDFEEGFLQGYNEIEYDNLGNRAWAQQRNGNFAAQEFDIHTADGIGSPIGNHASWHGMEFVNGTLYAAGFAGAIGDPALAILNPDTGDFSILGQFGFAVLDQVITGLAYDPITDTVYGIDNGNGDEGSSVLYTVNLDNGSLTPVGPTGIFAGALEIGPDGNLYAGGVYTSQGNLYRINKNTAASTFIGATGFGTGEHNGISGLALVGSGLPVSIPTMNEWGMIILSLLLGVSVIWIMKRRQAV